MKTASSVEKLSSTGDFASRVKSLISNSPLVKRRRSMSLHSAPLPSKVFGTPLEQLWEGDVPFIIRKIVGHVEHNGLQTEGLYRINGNAKNIEKLKALFDKVGDANFEGEDIPPIAGLLKLFLRELPDAVIPASKMSEFLHLQQTSPSEPSLDDLSALKALIHTLPPANYATLKYLIQHLAKVAQHRDMNKMTAVSLSIVFGPNIFHCGDGIQGLQLQGFSNSTVCRMVLHHAVLFGGVEEIKMRKKTSPIKPRPYSEHVANKKTRPVQVLDHTLSPIRMPPFDSTSDLERSYSEKSIDEAILERTMSPASPAPSHDGKSPSQENEDSSFQRQYAKRGLKYSQRSSGGLEDDQVKGQYDESSEVRIPSPIRGQGSPSHSRSVFKRSQNSAVSMPSSDNMSASVLSSLGDSPYTSPTITPRSSRMVDTVVEQSIEQYLFQPGPTTTQTRIKADVYGLLLPEKSEQQSSHRIEPLVKRRRTSDARKVRHRKSSLYSDSTPPTVATPEGGDLEARSVSPEHCVETRQGRFSDLVARFDNEGADGEAVEGAVDVKKRKPSNKAFELFEQKGLVIAMAGPRVSFASTTTTISPTPSPYTSPTHHTPHTPHTHMSSRGSDDLTTVSNLLSVSSTNRDEDVFSSPAHSTHHTGTQSTLSTSPAHSTHHTGTQSTLSRYDDVFLSNDNDSLDIVKRDAMLVHRNLSRPRGPANRRRPSQSPRLSLETNQSDSSPVLKDELLPVGPSERSKVTEGWHDDVDSGELSVQEMTARLNVLKRDVRGFEAQFFSTHLRKPIGDEKGPIRHLLEEASTLRKQVKGLQGLSTSDHDASSPPRASQPSLTITSDCVDQESYARLKPSLTITSDCVDQESYARLKGALYKLMNGLDNRRQANKRPEDLHIMSVDQLSQEKRDIQKALLQFERVHGRPSSRHDKEAMRPLYDRYRLVKRLTSADHRGYTPGHSRHSLGTTTDTLPSVTLLHSTTLTGLPSNAVASGEEAQEILTDSQLKKATIEALIQQNKLLLETKKELRILLREFETKFETENGRTVEKEERGHMQQQYTQYKDVKTKLKIVAAQLSKNLPQKTI